jgi:hypothetical protein
MAILSAKPSERYAWTNHAYFKMKQYRLSESLVKRVIRYPARIEQGILEDAIAVMRPASASMLRRGEPAKAKNYSEIWAMYVTTKRGQLRIITAWRYPGRSPERDPIPAEILEEVRKILF